MRVKNKLVCRMPLCDRPVVIVKHKLCRAHSNQLYRAGAVSKKPLRPYIKRKFRLDDKKSEE